MKQYRSDPLTEREKAFLRRSKGIMLPHSAAVGPKPIDKPKERTFIAPVSDGWKPPRKKRGGSGCRMSPEHRAALELHKTQRELFFKALRGEV